MVSPSRWSSPATAGRRCCSPRSDWSAATRTPPGPRVGADSMCTPSMWPPNDRRWSASTDTGAPSVARCASVASPRPADGWGSARHRTPRPTSPGLLGPQPRPGPVPAGVAREHAQAVLRAARNTSAVGQRPVRRAGQRAAASGRRAQPARARPGAARPAHRPHGGGLLRGGHPLRRRRRPLLPVLSGGRRRIAFELDSGAVAGDDDPGDDVYLVDLGPVPGCGWSRAARRGLSMTPAACVGTRSAPTAATFVWSDAP